MCCVTCVSRADGTIEKVFVEYGGFNCLPGGEIWQNSYFGVLDLRYFDYSGTTPTLQANSMLGSNVGQSKDSVQCQCTPAFNIPTGACACVPCEC